MVGREVSVLFEKAGRMPGQMVENPNISTPSTCRAIGP
jgi:hypothetical protein